MNDDGEHRPKFESDVAALARWDGEGGGKSRARRLSAPWKAKLRRPELRGPFREDLHGAQILSSRCRDPE